MLTNVEWLNAGRVNVNIFGKTSKMDTSNQDDRMQHDGMKTIVVHNV